MQKYLTFGILPTQVSDLVISNKIIYSPRQYSKGRDNLSSVDTFRSEDFDQKLKHSIDSVHQILNENLNMIGSKENMGSEFSIHTIGSHKNHQDSREIVTKDKTSNSVTNFSEKSDKMSKSDAIIDSIKSIDTRNIKNSVFNDSELSLYQEMHISEKSHTNPAMSQLNIDNQTVSNYSKKSDVSSKEFDEKMQKQSSNGTLSYKTNGDASISHAVTSKSSHENLSDSFDVNNIR